MWFFKYTVEYYSDDDVGEYCKNSGIISAENFQVAVQNLELWYGKGIEKFSLEYYDNPTNDGYGILEDQ